MKTNELRTLVHDIEIRKAEDGSESRTITGYGVVFESWSHDLGYFREKVSRNAFDGVDFSDVVATFNHNFDYVVGRTSAGTLRLSIDQKGLKYEIDVPNTTAGNDLLENVRAKNVVGSSFMFTIAEQRWTWKSKDDEIDEREILKVDRLYELGPVTMPAYPETTASARALYEEARQREVDAHKETAAEEKAKRVLSLKIKIAKNK